LLLCKEGQFERVQSLVEDSGLGATVSVKEVTKTLKASDLNAYDQLLLCEGTKLGSKYFKRRHFPFPIKMN